MSCDHRKLVKPAQLEWIDDGWSPPGYQWSQEQWESTTVDLDLHRFQCTLCGEIRYYSDRAHRQALADPGIVNRWVADWNNR